jgi:hypothetical protein
MLRSDDEHIEIRPDGAPQHVGREEIERVERDRAEAFVALAFGSTEFNMVS